MLRMPVPAPDVFIGLAEQVEQQLTAGLAER